jgi:hypothetical protein
VNRCYFFSLPRFSSILTNATNRSPSSGRGSGNECVIRNCRGGCFLAGAVFFGGIAVYAALLGSNDARNR